jgi:hypothetical protein
LYAVQQVAPIVAEEEGLGGDRPDARVRRSGLNEE